MRLWIILTLLAALPAPAAAGALYRFVDHRGVVHFTNAPTDRRYARVEPQPVRPARQSSRRSPAERRRTGRQARYDALIESAALHHGVPPALVKAVIATESAFRPDAVSSKGAMGLMQLMPQTARFLGVESPFQAEENVFGGTRYLRRLHDRFGSWTHTLAAYNAGPTAVARYRGVPPYRETRQYVKKVLSYYRRFHGDFAR
jgi:soluble lytic murein transglycosylase